MTQCPVEYVIVEIKMTPCNAKFRSLEPPDALNYAWKEKSQIGFSYQYLLFMRKGYILYSYKMPFRSSKKKTPTEKLKI